MKIEIDFFPDKYIDQFLKAVDEGGYVTLLEYEKQGDSCWRVVVEASGYFSFLSVGILMGLNDAFNDAGKAISQASEAAKKIVEGEMKPSTN